MSEKRVFIEFPEYKLEGMLYIPSGVARYGVVICHPHPQYGGDMWNNVVMGVQDVLYGAGFGTLRYNFRGVGRSGGALAGPQGDAEDLNRVIEYFLKCEGINSDKVAVAGYSYGAAVALTSCKDDIRVKALVAFSPPVGLFPMEFIKNIKKPLIVIAGDMDAFCPLKKLQQLLPPQTNIEILKGVDHFYSGFEIEAGKLTATFLKNQVE